MYDAHYARMLTNLRRYPDTFIKKNIKFYVPRTSNEQLDDTIEEILSRASKGHSNLKCSGELRTITVIELYRRSFILEISDDRSCNIRW